MNPIAHLFKKKTCIICHKEFQPIVGNQICCGEKDCKKVRHNQISVKSYGENKEIYKARQKKYYQENLAKVRETKRKWNNDPKNTDKRKYNPSYRKPYTLDQYKKINSREKARKIMRQNNIIKICSYKFISHMCNKRIEVHHKDQNVFNNNIENLEYICSIYHKYIHRQLRLGNNVSFS